MVPMIAHQKKSKTRAKLKLECERGEEKKNEEWILGPGLFLHKIECFINGFRIHLVKFNIRFEGNSEMSVFSYKIHIKRLN